MGRGRYTGYRGRTGTRNVLHIVAGILAVLLVLLVLMLLLGQRYIYYGTHGVNLDLPFAGGESAPPDVSNVVVEILPPATPPSVSGEQEGEGQVGDVASSSGGEENPSEDATTAADGAATTADDTVPPEDGETESSDE